MSRPCLSWEHACRQGDQVQVSLLLLYQDQRGAGKQRSQVDQKGVVQGLGCKVAGVGNCVVECDNGQGSEIKLKNLLRVPFGWERQNRDFVACHLP
jgi:hypothetical protein